MDVIAATNNKNKLREFRQILKPHGFNVLTQAQAGVSVEPEETGSTFAENAMIKARAIYEATGKATVADDSGLCVDYLNGEPGIYSARYGASDLDDKGRLELVLKKMEGVPKEKRSAYFMCGIAFINSDGTCVTASGRVDGIIAFEPAGENGFGYDPIFFVPELGKTFAEASPEEKNALSHRGRALAQLEEKLTIG